MLEPGSFMDETREGVTVVHSLASRLLDPGLADVLTRHLCGLLESGAMCLLINMEGVSRMSSVFIRSFIAAGKKARETGASVNFCNISTDIKRVFTLTALDKLFRIFGTEAEAFGKLARDQA